MGNAQKDSIPKDTKKDKSKSEDEKLDEALDETFPASDPPAMTEPVKHLGSAKKGTHREKAEPPKA